jgi:hypothetical protein
MRCYTFCRTKKNRRKIVTPDDIDSLFVSKTKASTDDNEDNNDEGGGAGRGGLVRSGRREFKDDDDADDADDADDDDDDDDDAATDGDTQAEGSKSVMPVSATTSAMSASDASFKGIFNPTQDEIPKWLADGEKEAKKKKKLNKRKKKLTDDWRFWAAIIATVGFASALYTVYQQTGGFGSPGDIGIGFGPGPSSPLPPNNDIII